MLHNLIEGLTSLGNGQLIAYLVVGSIGGMFLGLIPGLGGPVILSVILAFVYHISLGGTLCLFLAVHAASYFSASTTSILLNAPAHPEAFAVTFDGFPMAQKGEAGRALGISAVSTFIGGVVGCAVLVGFIQVLNNLPNLFHPPEYVALVTLTLVLVGTLGSESATKALVSAGLGIMIASIGSSAATGQTRFTFGAAALVAGVPLVAVALGSFAVPQMIMIFGTGTAVAGQDMLGREVAGVAPARLGADLRRQVFVGMHDAIVRWKNLIGAGLIGVLTGIVPGIGGFAANFLSYGVAQQLSRKRREFGTGIPEGVVAAEGSSMAKEAGGLVPLLGLGIPGSVGGALFLAALTIKGVTTGYGFATTYPTLPYEMAWIIAFGGLIGTAAGLVSAPLLARVTRLSGPLIVPFVMALAALGAFVTEVSFFVVMEVLLFTAIGFILRRLRYSLAAFAVGLVLGPTLEENIHLTATVYPGITFLQRPGADVLFAIVLLVLAVKVRQMRADKRLRESAAAEEEAAAPLSHDRGRAGSQQYPWLGALTTLVLVVICGVFAFYGATHYTAASAVMPVAGASVAGVAALARLPQDLFVVVRRLQRRRDARPGEPAPVPEEAVDASERPSVVRGAWGRRGQFSRELAAFGWFAACIGSCWLFGFRVGVPVFCGLYGLGATGVVLAGWWRRIAFAVVSAVVMGAAAIGIFQLMHLSFSPAI